MKTIRQRSTETIKSIREIGPAGKLGIAIGGVAAIAAMTTAHLDDAPRDTGSVVHITPDHDKQEIVPGTLLVAKKKTPQPTHIAITPQGEPTPQANETAPKEPSHTPHHSHHTHHTTVELGTPPTTDQPAEPIPTDGTTAYLGDAPTNP